MIKVKNDKYIAGIDGLRAIAVMLVVLFHVGFSTFSGGYVGVDVFFVISGFLITRLITDEVKNTGNFDLARFYYRRARRLFPALFTTILATLVFAIILFTPQHLKRFGGEVVFSIFSLSNFFFLGESGYFNTASEFKPLLHTWSLSVEEQFYLVWPAIIIATNKFGRSKATAAAIVFIFSTSLLLSFSFSDGQSFLAQPFGKAITDWLSDGASTIYYFTPMRAFEFCIGAILVFFPNFNYRPAVADIVLASGIAMIVYPALRYDATTLFPSYNALLPCVGAALSILACDAKRVGALLRSKPLVQIGLISYSVYLVHWPLIVFTKYFLMRELDGIEKSALTAASIVFGYTIYKTIETPLRHGGSSNKKAQFGLACAALAMLAILPASIIWSSDGWKWRVAPIPTEIEKQLSDSKQFHIDQYGGDGYPYQGWISKGASDQADIILIGDSHARHYAKGLDEVIGKPLKKNIYISSVSCIMLPGMTRVTPGYDWDTDCKQHLDEAIKVILSSDKNSIVIVSHSWVEQLKNSGTLNPTKKLEFNSQTDGYHFVSEKINELSRIVEHRKIVVIGDVPGSGVTDLAGCFSRPSIFKVDCDAATSIKQSALEIIDGNNAMKHDIESMKNVTFMSPQEVLCENERCKSIIGGSVVYSDKRHLSKFGSVVVIKGLADKIESELNRKI